MTKGAKTTHGQRTFACILNGLGFFDSRHYLFPKYLETKPVSKLIGPDIDCNFFNDDSIGRCLDAIHEYVKTRLFSQIALAIALEHNILKKSVHLDTTTLSVYGDYKWFYHIRLFDLKH